MYESGQQEKAFRGIVDAYSERLYWHVRRFLCSHDDTNDLLQDIFIKVWSALPTFRGEAQLYTWLYRIATNMVLNHLRKQKLRALVSFDSAYDILEKKIDEDAYFNGNELYVKNMHVAEYWWGSWGKHDPRRDRKLLLTRKELNRLQRAVKEKGLTIVGVKLYIAENGYAKMLIALARGKKEYDKRASIKEKDLRREMERI